MRRILCRMGLAFERPDEEEAFFQEFALGHIGFARVMLFLAAALLLMFILWDRVIDPVGATNTMWIRIFIMAPAVVLAGLLLYWPATHPHVEAILTAASVTTSVSLTIICARLNGGFNMIGGGLELIILVVFALLPMRTPAYLLFCLCTIAGYYLIQPDARGMLRGMPSMNALMIGSALILGGLSVVSRELAARARFRAEQELARAHGRIEELLHSMLPAPIARRIQQGETFIADEHSGVSIVFSDLVKFTEFSNELTPERVVSHLNRMVLEFDRRAEKAGMQRIKIMGDGYMAVGGLAGTSPRGSPAQCGAALALQLIEAIDLLRDELGLPLQLRVGLHVGTVVAGVIGTRPPAFDCWGPAVTLARRLEMRAEPGTVLVSEAAWLLLRDTYVMEPRGSVELKGIGGTLAYRLGPLASDAACP